MLERVKAKGFGKLRLKGSRLGENENGIKNLIKVKVYL